MTHRSITVLLVLMLAVLGGALYATRLGYAPIYVMHDESQFALQSQSIAATGHDLSGRFMPVFFTEPEFPAGRDPMIMYATAAILKLLPFSESSVRLPTALVGVLDIVLVFFVARVALGSNACALLAAVLIALTPAHFIRARLALSPYYSIPFVLLWLWTVIEFDRQPTARRAALAGAWLALGVYTYLACVVMMPMYLAATCVLAYKHRDAKAGGVAIVAFAIVLVPMLIWYATHPERIQQIAGSYRLYSDTPDVSISQAVQARLRLYWSFFDPAFLFVSGDSSLINSTRRIGFFPMAFVVFIPAGLYWMWKGGRTALWIIGLGFLTAPLASIVSGAVEMNRLMFAIPFGALTAAAGAISMLTESRWTRIAALLLLASVPLQFARFYADYMGPYRSQSAPWFGGNMRDAVNAVIADQPRGSTLPVYVGADVPFSSRYWRFYAIAGGREDLIARLQAFTTPPDDAAPGSHVICQAATTQCQAMVASPRWRRIATAAEPDRTASFEVLAKQPGF